MLDMINLNDKRSEAKFNSLDLSALTSWIQISHQLHTHVVTY